MKPASHTPRPFSALPKRQREFVAAYIRSGDARESYVSVGYKDGRSTMAKAAELLKEVTPYLQVAQREYLEGVEMAILGGKVVSELARNADNETVRLNAAKELLSRAAPEKARESTITHVHKTLTNDQVDARIKELQDELFVDAPQATVVAIK
jgi:phage terminase small subunit